MTFSGVISAEECAQQAQIELERRPADEGTVLSAIAWALLSIAVSLEEHHD